MVQIDFRKVFFDNIDNLIKLLSIKSMYDKNSVSDIAPYGERVNDALLFMKQLAISDGYEVKEYNGQAISIEHGDTDSRIDIVSHLDVVVANDADFNIRIENDKLYGRGTSDMKVSLYLTYLCLKLLREKYPSFKRKLRLVFGTDEERTMNDMHYYISQVDKPDFAFTPDGTFPLALGEKGDLMWTLSGDYKGIIKYMHGGSQCNTVSSYASATIFDTNITKVEEYIVANNMSGKVTLDSNELKIMIYGVKAHASRPYLGHSATIDLLKLLSDLYNDQICGSLYDNYHNYYGAGFNNYICDKPDESLTVNLGFLEIKDNKIFGQVDCRYPYIKNALEITKDLKKVSKVNVSLDYNDDPIMCDINDEYVQLLLKAYRDVSGDYTKPYIASGASYSKVFKHCVSFGPNNLNKESMAHKDGEYVYIDDVIEWFKIYYEAMKRLALMEDICQSY